MASIIDMPKLSDTMTVGTLVKWLKKEGDPVKSGDMLAEVETDKATMELESFYEGTLLKIFAQPGSQVAIGAPLAAVGKPGETVPEPAASPAAAAPAPAPIAAQPIPAPAPAVSVPAVPAAAPSTNGSRVKISPLARKVATDKGVDFSRLLG